MQEMKPLSDSETFGRGGPSLNGLPHTFQDRMVEAEHSYRLISIARRHKKFARIRNGAAALLLAALAWVVWTGARVRRHAQVDDAQPADVIVVMGAAEYRGKPSPVLQARLEHALELFQKKMAPHIITTGGAGGDPVFTESTVGRNYLMGKGVPTEAIILEDEADSTIHSAVAVAEIMHRMGLRKCILVTDGYHIFRAKKMLEARGLTVYGSPRVIRDESSLRDWWMYARQAIGYGLWRAGVPI